MRLVDNAYVLVEFSTYEKHLLSQIIENKHTIPDDIASFVTWTQTGDLAFVLPSRQIPILNPSLPIFILASEFITVQTIMDKISNITTNSSEKNMAVETDTHPIIPSWICKSCGAWGEDDIDSSEITVMDGCSVQNVCVDCGKQICESCIVYCVECVGNNDDGGRCVCCSKNEVHFHDVYDGEEHPFCIAHARQLGYMKIDE